jgi:hypothetical protein
MAAPTKEQFLRNSRAKELRQICLDLARARKAEQERCKNRLSTLGITPKYQAHLVPSAYEDPVTMAEWVAGQWLSYLNELSPEKPLMEAALEKSVLLQINAQFLFPE